MSGQNGVLTKEEFYGKFRKDYLPSYDFFRLFFAKLSLKGIALIESNQLKSFLQKLKEENKYPDLLFDVHFYFNGFNYVSRDVEENLNTLQTLGALGRSNPSYEMLLNYFSSSSARKILSELSNYEGSIDRMINDFEDFIKINGK